MRSRLFVILLLLLGAGLLAGVWVARKSAEEKHALTEFNRVGRLIELEFHKNKSVYSAEKIERMRAAAKLLQNKLIDDDILVYACELRNDANTTYVAIKYVDEKERACQLSYSPSVTDVNDIGEVVVPANEFPKNQAVINGKIVVPMRTGRNSIYLVLKRKAGIEVDSEYEQTPYYEINRTMCEMMLAGKGQFILIDSQGVPLCRVPITEVRSAAAPEG